MGKRIHTSAVLAEFTSLTLPDDKALCFYDHSLLPHVCRHKVSAILANPERYASAVKRIVITDAGLAPRHTEVEDIDGDQPERRRRIALYDLLAVCSDLEAFVWRSNNPPPEGFCEVCHHT